MRNRLDALSEAETLVLARVRMAVAARLVSLAGAAVPELDPLSRRKPFVLALAAPRVPRAYVRSDGRSLAAFTGGERPAGRVSLTLRFASPRAAARVLSGGGGAPFPLFSGGGCFAALAFFRAAAVRAPALLADPAVEPALRARLLAAAALAGLCEAAGDPALAERLSHVPEGAVAVLAPGAFEFGVEKRGGILRFLDAVPRAPEARLEFRDAASAIAVFTGARPAVLALGSGEVSIRGLLPLVQGLFAVLDRLGEYLAVRARVEETR